MCVAAAPAVIAYASMAATAISTAFSVYSSIQEGNAAQAVANMQAAEADRQAQERITQGQQQEQDHRLKVAQLIGQQTAGFAAAGVDTSSGSPLGVIGDTAALGETDALRIRSNTYSDANSLSRQAEIYRAEGEAARTTGLLNAGGSLLTGAASVGSSYYNLTQSGALSTKKSIPVGGGRYNTGGR